MKIFVKVKPRSREQNVKKIDNEHFIISVKEPADKGLANRAIIKSLAEYFAVPKGNLEIVTGLNARKKIIKIE